MNNGKINWQRAILAGALGTVLFDIISFAFTQNWWDVPQILGAQTGLGLAFGVIGHYSNGILIAILYAGIEPSLWGPKWLRAIIFTTGETIALVWFFMLPLLGAGVAGLKLDPLMPFTTLVRHWVYAIPLIFLINVERPIFASKRVQV